MKVRHWPLSKQLFVGVASVVGLIATGMLMASPWCSFYVNLTNSLPGHVYVIVNGRSVGRNDIVGFHWRGGATYPRGVVFLKEVAGVAGDRVERVDRTFWVNDRLIGVAKPYSKAGVPLVPATAGVIPAGHYFVATPNPNSLDSRYSLLGTVSDSELIGKAYELF